MPRFSVEYEAELIPVLQALGIKSPFEKPGQLTDISDSTEVQAKLSPLIL